MRTFSDRFAALLIKSLVSAVCLLSCSVHAASWQEFGQSDVSLDKIYVDVGTIVMDGNFRVVQVMSVYDKSRPNSHGVWMDRHIQKLAFDCANRTFSPISTTGYIDGKRVGSSPVHVDWKDDVHPIAASASSQRMFALACNAPLTTAGAGAGTAATPVLPARHAGKTGTGIIINRDGDILTNNHVISGCTTLTVRGSKTPVMPAVLVTTDAQNDLALLHATTTFAHSASFREQTRPARLGEEIGVIGYPLSGLLSAEPKATFGQVNSVAGMRDDYRLLQISAPVQPGNSGGPVLDGTGAVIGVVVSQASMAMAAITGSVPQNINFAIRGELAQIFLNAHGVKYNIAKPGKKLETDDIAENGQQFTVMIRCD